MKHTILATVLVLVLGLVGIAIGQVGKGNILFEYWFNLGGTNVSDLTGSERYPDNPDDSEWRTSFDAPLDKWDYYGTRVRGYLYPPGNGDYTFWIASDDASQLWLSSDDNPANAVQIASVPGWTSHLEWGKYPEQKSASQVLQAGKKYYMEALMKEDGGGDNLAVAWQGPGIADRELIDGQYLSPVVRPHEPLFKASSPDPQDGTQGVTQPLLRWTAGKTTTWHDVYFGTNPTPGPAEFIGRQESSVCEIPTDLLPETTYYWRIDEVEADGVTIHEGDVWSFRVAAYPDYADVLGARFVPSHFTALGELNLSSGQSIHFDTSRVTFSIDGGVAQSGVIAQTRRATETAVFCFTNMTIADGAKVTLAGDRAIAILSHADMTIGATFDAGGGNGTSTSGGLGRLGSGNGGTGQMVETAPTAGEGPGAGGVPPQLWAWHGGGGGGYGGPGGLGGTESGLPSPGGLSYNTADELEIDLLGGSGGGGGYHYGGGGGNGGCAGAGGGAIELTASGNITILSTGRIIADGGSGYDANWRSGGGGGSGGMVLLCADGIVSLERNSQITARGGNGGSSYSGAGGGGGGGGGGQVAVYYYVGLTNNGLISAAAGSGGVGPSANGEDGYDGRIIMRQLGATLSAPAELQFGKVEPGEAISLEFCLENFDLLPVEVASIAVVGRDNEYFEVLSPIGAFTVEPGEPNRVPVIVRFNPDRRRECQARLDINSSGGHSEVRLLGEGMAGTVRPVVHYKMDDDNELTKITDSSGSGFHGQRANMRACHWVDGRFSSGAALDFDGFRDYVSVPAIYSMNAITITMWVKPDQLTAHSYTSLYSCNGSESGDISLRFKNDGTLEFALCGNIGGNVSAEVANSVYDRFEEHAGAHPMDAHRGYWIHLAIVYDSTVGTVDFYVNGQPNVHRTFSTALPASFAGGQIGGWDGGGKNFNGIIDEFRIYDHALSPEQVEEIAKFEHELWAVRDIHDWKSPSTVIHVDGQAGNDANPGTPEEPVATIGKALELVSEPGTKVLIYPGTYREANLQLAKSGTRFEPIIIEANEPGTVIISGSEIWSGWQNIGGGMYTHSWPYDWGDNTWGWSYPEGVPDISRRREMVFVDGELYTQTSQPAGAPAKTYCVDEANDKLYLFMPAGQSPADHMIDVVTGDVLFNCGRDYYTLRGLVFQHANVAVWAGGSHILIEDCSFNYCNSQGIYLGWGGSEDIVMRRCAGNHNGLRSFYPDRPIFDVLIEDCITNYNNWRLYWGGDIGAMSMKAMYARHMIVRRHEAVSNLAKGLWFDCDNRNIIVDDCLIANNLTDGIWSEINPDGVVIRNCVIAHNQFTGLVIANSEHLIIENNKIFGNNWQQLGMWEPDEYRDIEDEFTDLVTHNLVLKNNWIVGETSSQKLLDWAGWSGLYSTMDSQNNKWYRPGTRDGFYVDWSNKNWTQWQVLVPQDTTSGYLYSAPDLSPPTPDPLGWQTEPTASGNTSITMTAATATDTGGVEYYFCNLTDHTHDSGWQSEPTYHDTGLAPGRKYFYRVRARDNSAELNETWWSVPACAMTLATATDERTLTVSSTSGGSVSVPGEGTFAYDHGTVAATAATAETNYHFVNWSGTAVDAGKVGDPNSASTTVTMDSDYTLQANFAIDQRTLTVSSTSGGSVSVPGEGAFDYDHGTTVSVTATPELNCHFVEWAGTAVDAGRVAEPSSANTTVAMDADYTLQANFTWAAVKVVARPQPSDCTATTIPDHWPSYHERETFYLELWAQVSHHPAGSNGLSCVFGDITFDSNIVSAESVEYCTNFSAFSSGTLKSSLVDELGGCTLTAGLGITPQWALIARLKMTAYAQGQTDISLNCADTGCSVIGYGRILSDQIALESCQVTVGSIPETCIYDLDGDGFLGPGDLSLFVCCWLRAATDSGCDGRIPCVECDFDCDGTIGPGDLAWFATGWLNQCGDPAIKLPLCPRRSTAGRIPSVWSSRDRR